MNSADACQTLCVNWSYPTSVRFGPGRITELVDCCRSASITRPLLVSDPALAHLPVMTTILESCRAAELPVDCFNSVKDNPAGSHIEQGIVHFRRGDHDGIIALGGGSALDTGKAIAFQQGQSRPLWDFEDREDWWTRADPTGIAPVIAIPTTAGTGSEVGRAAVILDEKTQGKKIIFHPAMLPREVIADPELTLSLPASLTAATGMDALSHALEAFSGSAWHPMSQGIALEAIRLVKEWLLPAVQDGSRIEPRAGMMAASSMGAVAFQKGLGAIHAMSHPCSSLCGTHHGLTNAVLMPYVLLHNRAAIDSKMAALARYLDLPRQNFDGLLEWVLALREQTGIPGTLAEIGVHEDALTPMPALALADPANDGNPVKMSRADYETLYRKAFDGNLR